MQKKYLRMFAAILISGSTTLFASCVNDDNPAPNPARPKRYDLLADEYKEVILDSMLWINIASIPQDQGDSITIESPKSGAQIRFKDLRAAAVKEMFK